MKSWPAPAAPSLVPEAGDVVVFNQSSGALEPVLKGRESVSLYVCGITPYDATHLGHAFTYLSFDLLNRALRDCGSDVLYVQNVTDVDDPLLERARDTGVDWRDLAQEQTDLFRSDMEALRVLPPEHYLGVVETVGDVVGAVTAMLENGTAYRVGQDVYADLTAAHTEVPFGQVSGLDPERMEEVFAERGGDPGTEGKRDRLDPLLWRGEREGEPSWDGGVLGAGRPGWHVECSAIAHRFAGLPLAVQAGGSDLMFPHHEMGNSHTLAAWDEPLAEIYAYTGMVGLDGRKMSKSLGNLEFVSRLLAEGESPAAIRLALLSRHYRSDWEWDRTVLTDAVSRLERWRTAFSTPGEPFRHIAPDAGRADAVVHDVRRAIRVDLDAPAALEILDEAAGQDWSDTDQGTIRSVVDALLGIDLAHMGRLHQPAVHLAPAAVTGAGDGDR